MDIDKFYRLMGAAIKRLYGFYVIRPLQRFNVDNKAEKLIEKQIPRTAPRHKGTDIKFKQISEGLYLELILWIIQFIQSFVCHFVWIFITVFAEHPEFRKQLEERREDLLNRLKSVKVVSKEVQMSEEEIRIMEEMKDKVRNRLPQSREGEILPSHAFNEPKYVPKGRVSLFGALEFLAKHTKTPHDMTPEIIAKQYNLKLEDVNNILMYFRPLYKYGGEENIEKYDKQMIGILSFERFTQLIKPRSDKKTSDQQIKSTSSNESSSSEDSKQINEKKDQKT